jgi:hypothetical protein
MKLEIVPVTDSTWWIDHHEFRYLRHQEVNVGHVRVRVKPHG